MRSRDRLLFDTCAVILSATGGKVQRGAAEVMTAATATGHAYVSPLSAWEIGIAIAKGRLTSPLHPLEFFNRFLTNSNCALCELTPEILVDSSFLPGTVHKDPADRIIIATARALDLVLVTRDRAILAYGVAGHVRTLAC